MRRGLGALAAVAAVMVGTGGLAQTSAGQKDIEARCLGKDVWAGNKEANAQDIRAACTAFLARRDLSFTQEWNAFAQRAMAADVLRDHAGAEKDFGEALERSPAGQAEAELHYKRGLSRIALGDNAGAEADMARAIVVEPRLRHPGVPQGAHAAYAFCAGYLVNASLVLSACERVVAAKPTNPDILATAQATRGKALLVLGQPFRAIEALGAAIYSGASPEIVEGSYRLRSLAYEETDQLISAEGDLQKAEAIMKTLPKSKGQPAR